VRPRSEPDEGGWESLLDGTTFAGRALGEGWTVEQGVLTGRGPAGLSTMKWDYMDVEARAELHLSSEASAELAVRRRPAAVDGVQRGYRAVLRSAPTGPGNTGGLAYFGAGGEGQDLGRPVRTQLVPPDRWFELRMACRNTPDGVRVTTRVNGIVIRDEIDRQGDRGAGGITFEVSGSDDALARIRKFEVRELR
jgi:hypothetical protein